MVSRKEQDELDAKAAAKEAAAKKRAREAAAREAAEEQQGPTTAPVAGNIEFDPTAVADTKGPRVSTDLGFRPGERLDTNVEDPRLANENTRRDMVEQALSQKQRDTNVYPATPAEIKRQQDVAKAVEEARARDAAERQYHRNAFSEELGTGIDGLLQVLYRRGLVSILDIEAITGKDIPEAEEKEMEADRNAA